MTAPAARMVVKLKRRSGAHKKQSGARIPPARLLRQRPPPKASPTALPGAEA